MRELKFRAWSQVNKRMMPYEEISTDSLLVLNSPPYDDIYMQYTGLKDKNGREIYEGDIISDSGVLCGVAIFDQGGFCIEERETNETALDGMTAKKNKIYPLDAYDHAPEIIGNIYENPELLNAIG